MKTNRKGFTLIELLIVVVIIGILAAIAIPKFANTKEKAYLATMKSDLRNLATAEEAYFADNKVYFSASAIGNATPINGYGPSSGVSVTPAVNGGGWNATASYTASLTTKTCGIKVGTSTDPSGFTGLADGEPVCK